MDRRLFLSLVAGCAVWPSIAHAVSRSPIALRRLRLVNAHTGETFEGAYRNDKGPIERVMDELCIFLRDHHSGEKTQIDVGLVDFLADVLDAVGETKVTIGWYPQSGFIHIDTGPIRNWTIDERGLEGLLIFDGRRLRLDGTSQELLGAPWRQVTVAQRLTLQHQLAEWNSLPASVFASARNPAG